MYKILYLWKAWDYINLQEKYFRARKKLFIAQSVIKAKDFCSYIAPVFMQNRWRAKKSQQLFWFKWERGDIQPSHAVWHPHQGLREERAGRLSACAEHKLADWQEWGFLEGFISCPRLFSVRVNDLLFLQSVCITVTVWVLTIVRQWSILCSVCEGRANLTVIHTV